MYSQHGALNPSNGSGRLIPMQPRQSAIPLQEAFMDADSAASQTPHHAPNSESTNTIPFSQRHRQITASCVLCRRRKVKCDRQNPCGNCARAGRECVPFIPSRLPRGRQGGRKKLTADSELIERVAKLENLLRDVEGCEMSLAPSQTDGRTSASKISSAIDVDRSKSPVEGLDRYLATSFWVTLSQEISGLKDVLEDASNDEDESGSEQTFPSDKSALGLQQQQQPNHSGFIVSRTASAESLICPTRHQIYTFCDIYLANVDPVLKILHGPSLRKFLQEDTADLDCSPGGNGLDALRYAVYFAAIATLEDAECRHRTGEDKAVLLASYRVATELALAKADFVNTVEMSTLQALAIYLTSVRVNDNSRLMWTLVSLAVRIAQAMGLHLEGTLRQLRPFEREMRRRLWWQICALDSHAAEDRATNPVVAAESFNTKLPLRINDDDICLGSSEDVKEREGFTEMTFCLICHEIFDTVRQLNYVPARELGPLQPESQEETWRRRIDMVVQVQRRIEERYVRHLNLARPFQWTARMVADLITATMWLLIYRPLQRHPDISMSQIADPGILRLSVDVLERAYQLYTDPAASSFRWLSRTHVQWHAIAVTTAELCIRTEGPVVERAWAILEPVFKENAKDVADSDKGMLWRPIKKLMNKARSVRQHYLESHPAMTHALATATATSLNTSDHENPLANECEEAYDFSTHEQQTVEIGAFPMEGLQQTPIMFTSAPFDWDPWLAAATANQIQQPSDMNLTAWTNWEDFIDEFQGQDEATSWVNGYAQGAPSLW